MKKIVALVLLVCLVTSISCAMAVSPTPFKVKQTTSATVYNAGPYKYAVVVTTTTAYGYKSCTVTNNIQSLNGDEWAIARYAQYGKSGVNYTLTRYANNTVKVTTK